MRRLVYLAAARRDLVACKGYVIFFRNGEDALEIVSVLEGHRDVDGQEWDGIG